jgi:hypothetical protein
LGSFCLGSRLSFAMELPEYLSEGPSLVNVRRKLDRAEQHLDRLEAAVAPYNNGDFHSVSDLKREGEWLVCRLAVAKAPDPEWGLWVGEFLHNTRSALDNLVWQLVLANDETPWCKNQFPIFTKPWGVPNKKRIGEMLRGVGADERAFIEELQPNRGGHIHRVTKRALAVLANLSNIDKHRYLNPAFGVIDPQEPTHVKVRSSHPVDEIRPSAGFLYDGAEVIAVRTAPEARVVVEGKLTIEVAFGEPGVTVSLLDGIHQQVVHVVERLASAFD